MDPEQTATAGPAGSSPEAQVPAVEGPRRSSWRRRIGFGIAFVLAIAVLAGFVIRVPYSTIAPGEALSLPPRVTVQGGKAYPNDRGDIRFLFVREAYHVNLWQYVRASLDSNIDLAKDGAINPSNLTPSQQEDEGLQQMTDAKSAATAVALKAAGYKVVAVPTLEVVDLFDDLPAGKVFRFGDFILSADGHKIAGEKDFTAAITKRRPGDQMTVGVLRAGKQVTLHVSVATSNGRNVLGVEVEMFPRYTFPVKVDVDTTGIGGPSAGLAMTLSIYDDLTPGNLTGGVRVAVTGTIDPGGNVGEIGGIAQKAVSARAAGVSLFIVPQCSPDDAPASLASCKSDLVRVQKKVGSKIKVVPVSTFAEALKALRDAGGAPVPTTVPPTSTTIPA